MLDTPRIYSQLGPTLQLRLAQLALLQQRAAVLARLPALTLAKGKPVRWAATPAPLLLRQVMALAALAPPQLSALLLRNWFQHKPELCGLVRQALLAARYPVPPLGVLPQPAPALLRLAPRDLSADGRHFCPGGQPLPGTDATPEEVTLMAELLGWCARRPGPDELPPAEEGWLQCLRLGYQALQGFEELIAVVLAAEPAHSPAARQAALGELPVAAAGPADWTELYRLYLTLRDPLWAMVDQPVPDPAVPVTRTELDEVLLKLEGLARYSLAQADATAWMLAALAQVGRVRHRQQPDFAPLAVVHAQALELAARVSADTGEEFINLMTEIKPFLALLDWIHKPNQLDQLDPQSEEMQQLEATLPPAVLNALLVRKLEVLEAA